mmetsp:Transcript_30898/g.66627  ORF Transcript_30898/g.66627 Transcript_30898/m.66627 type:complete len:293 (-) Transcript_30898:1949-2827(-)
MPQSAEHFSLNGVSGIQEGSAHINGSLQIRLARKKLTASFHLQNVGDGLLQSIPQSSSQLLQIVIAHGFTFIVFGDHRGSFAQLHIDEVQHGAKKWPLLVHLLQQRKLPMINKLLQGHPISKPHGQQEPRLGPGENPWNCAQGVDTTIVAALCWPASYVHLPKLRGRGEGMEETDKDVALTLEHRVLVVFGRNVCQLLHRRPELRFRQRRRRQGVLQHSGGVLLQAALGHLWAREVAANHLALNREPQVSVLQGPCGLRQHDVVWWPTTTTNGSTTTMEESDVHAMLFSHLQ